MQIIYWAVAIAIIIVALGIAISLIIKARVAATMAIVQSGEDEEQRLVDREEDLVKSLNGDLSVIRSARFGLTMAPVQRQVPARLRKER